MPYRTTRQFYRAVFPRNAAADPKLRVNVWRLSDDPATSVWVENRHASYRRAIAFPEWSLVWLRSGTLASVQRGRLTTREAGDVFVVPTHEHLGILPIDDQTYRLVVLQVSKGCQAAMAARLGADGEAFMSRLTRLQGVRGAGPETAALMATMVSARDRADAVGPLTDYLVGLLGQPDDRVDLIDEDEPFHPVTRRIIEVIENGYPPRINLRQLEVELGYSRGHIISIFKADMRTTPQQFLLIRKVGVAAARLIAGASIHDVVYDLNFSDQSHLTRAFQACLGMSPIRLSNRVENHQTV